MASKRELVVRGVQGLLEAALPGADVKRNASKPARLGPGGMAIVRDGDPGEPVDWLLSPLTYCYDHVVPVDVAAYESATRTREEALDNLLTTIGAAIEADRTLGGLCDWVEAEAPATDDGDQAGTEPFRWATVNVRCSYVTTSPLG